jgi:hypothetical protein
MKSTPMTRRSFIKRSSLGVVALANAALLTGLQSAEWDSGKCLLSVTYYFSQVCGPFDTKGEALDAGYAFYIDEGANVPLSSYTEVENWSEGQVDEATCQELDPPESTDLHATVEVTAEQGADGKWDYTLSWNFTINYCAMLT